MGCRHWIGSSPKPRRGFPGALAPVVLLALAGLAAGVAAKWLDVLALDDTVGWQAVLGRMDLRNVFSRPAAWAVLALPSRCSAAGRCGPGSTCWPFLPE